MAPSAASSSATGSPARPSAPLSRLRQALQSIPSRSPIAAKPLPLRLRSPADLESDLVRHRRACAEAHDALSALRDAAPHSHDSLAAPDHDCDRKGKGRAEDAQSWDDALDGLTRRGVVQLVAETMRLQLHLGHFSSAKELDRAFFSLRPGFATTIARQRSVGRKERATAAVRERGLGLSRGQEHSAWMASLAAQLQGGASDAKALWRFTQLLRDLRAGTGSGTGTGEIPKVVLSSLARLFPAVQGRLRGAACKRGLKNVSKERDEVRRLLEDFEAAELGDDDLVSLALLDSTAEKYEALLSLTEADSSVDRREVKAALDPDDPLFRRVEASMSSLLASLDDPDLPLPAQYHDTPSAPSTPTPDPFERRSHILHTAIRFLVIRALSPHPHATSPRAAPPLTSASQLYKLLLDSSPSVYHSREADVAFPRLRLRQSSALFRLLDAHLVSARQVSAAPLRKKQSNRHRWAERRDACLKTLSRALDLVEASLDFVSTLPRPPPSPLASSSIIIAPVSSAAPPDPRSLGLSPTFFRSLALLLNAPSILPPRAPEGAKPAPAPAAHLAPFALLLRALELLARARAWENGLLAPAPARTGKDKGQSRREQQQQALSTPVALQPLVTDSLVAHALARIALVSPLVAPSPPSFAAPAPAPTGDSPRARLVALFSALERAQEALPRSAQRRDRERARVARAVRAVLGAEWGGGGEREWRERMEEWVGEWERGAPGAGGGGG
ncbi:hypothetical protein Rhopal_003413-T1 [Rhodotorula paludigena]|uniref:Uncharacterized protein n=1 Tax=Rhodotorula paludigena TaxID=86838 RepID=A0AAV5GM06_9BASI|nr:hypothetical protein Rhopal_003413-T1 [Rhodotorula paludigena]